MIPALATRAWGKVLSKWDDKIVPMMQQAGIPSYVIAGIKMLLPQDEEKQIEITQKHLGEPAANLYLFHSEANENEHPAEGQQLADAVYAGMEGLINDLFGIFASVIPTFKTIARTAAEVPVQSLVEDKTLRYSSFADVTDDLHPILVINNAASQGVEEIEDGASRATKYILNGQLFIQKGDRIYTPQGQQIAQ